MEIIPEQESKKLQTAQSCIATEYLTSSPNINIARIRISGRFPETGVMWNTKVEEIVYIESGSGTVAIDGVEKEIKTGDVILYKKNEKVVWEGELVLIIACTPAWTADQHVIE